MSNETAEVTASSLLKEQLQQIIDHKTKPLGSLGRIEALALQLGSVQQTTSPSASTCRLIIFAADHGIAQAGVSAYPQEVTQQMVLNFLAGGAAANVFARMHGIDMTVVDCGVAGEPLAHPDLVDRRLGAGTANSLITSAMTDEQCARALAMGRELAAAQDVDALCLGEMGIGNTSAATLIAHKLFDLPIEALIGRGTGVSDEGLVKKQQILMEAAARVPGELSPERILAEWGGFEIAMMAGAMLGAAENRTLVIVDGFIATASAAIAAAIEPSSRDAMVFAHQSAEQGHGAMLAALSATPLLHLDMRLGEGSGALLAWPLVRSAAHMMDEMASFDSAGVSGPV